MQTSKRYVWTALLVLVAGLALAACGSTKHKPAAKKTSVSGAAKSQQSSAGSAALASNGSGAVTGTSTTSTIDTTAAVPPGTPAVDAVYGPPESAISGEDVPDGETPSELAENGSPSGTLKTTTRTAAAANYVVPTDQNFTAEWFSATSPWNTNITNLPVDPRSSAMLRLATFRVEPETTKNGQVQDGFVHDDKGLFINTVAWTDPVVTGGRLTPIHCRQVECGDDAGNKISQLQIPANVNPNPYYDGWFTVISPNGRYAYDMWRARRLADGSVSFQYMRIWDLEGPGYGKLDASSARGSGLPLFAGLIRPEELSAGTIDHALAISVPGPSPKYYVEPASTTDGNGETASLPEGARLRLNADVTIPPNSKTFSLTTGQRREASALLYTLRTYGAIVVDRAEVPTLYAQQGVTAPLLVGNELQFLHLDDFSVIQLPQEYQYPSATSNSSEINQVSSVGGNGGGF
jgi:hypothetical protein